MQEKKRGRTHSRWLLPAALVLAGAAWFENFTLSTSTVTAACAALPEAFSGLRIVQISDLHGKRFGKDDATDAEIEKAAAIAQATEFIEAKDDKYETAIAQGGTNVSGGQKQRLAIARAIAKDPKIFIFDDSFSALDLKTDAALRKALAENVKDSTVIIVAQRISTILHAEQILVLDDGKVVGKGTHEELLRSCEVYQEIAKSQLSEKELGLKESEVADHE